MISSRREFIKRGGLYTLAGAGMAAIATPGQAQICPRVSGAGSYLLGPFQNYKDPNKQGYLVTDLGFDETTVWCKVATNYDPIIFPTAQLGPVELIEHTFFMDMQATEITDLHVTVGSDGPQASFRGRVRTVTVVFPGEDQIIVDEICDFGCDATQLSQSAGIVVDKHNFSMTADFQDPTHVAIFGTPATFAGRLIRGAITINGF